MEPRVPGEPIALVGIGCRFPGGIRGGEGLWDFVCQGRDAITDVPEDRWSSQGLYSDDPSEPGKIYVRRAGFLENIRDFEPQFFGISPREAASMDPQQRLLLETAWEALEDAGIPPETLAGTSTGVFLGLFMHDYENLHTAVTERELVGSHSATGASPTISANRISYAFDLRGPSLLVDTACSSSLVALHLARESLLRGESSVCLAAGVNLILKPEMVLSLCKGSFLSPDGACKSFDARANGYVRSEGVAVLVLKRLSDAVASRDRIYALIPGTSVNHNGRSDGLTVPDVQAQMALIRQALAESGLQAGDIDFVEAHGTGTPVGDPVEARAIGAVLGSARSPANPCVMGSVKSNIGHTEAVAGIAGVIKAAMAVRHGRIPASLHFEQPNPQIPFEELRLRVPLQLEDWARNGDQPRAAAVNSFGFGGANAHAIVQEYREPAEARPKSAPVWLPIPLSAHSPEALRARAGDLSDFLAGPGRDETLADLGHTLALRQGQHNHRACFVARSGSELQSLLQAFLASERRPGMATGVVGSEPLRRQAWVFSGMGQQWWAMGRGLLEEQPVFRQVIQECHDGFSRLTSDWSLMDLLSTASQADSAIHETQLAQPAIFAVQVGVAAVLQSWGIRPDAVVGHSVGEVAAAYVSGALSLDDAIWLSFHRSRLQATTAGQGGMLAVGLPLARVTAMLEGRGGQVCVAAVNSPVAVTLAGETAVLDVIARELEAQGVFARPLKVEVPYHSPKMDPILAELGRELERLRPRSGAVPMVSTVIGHWIDGGELQAGYWTRNVRAPVLFAEAIQTLVEDGCDHFVEIGAHPVLASSIAECLAFRGKTSPVLSTLRRNEPDGQMMLALVAGLYARGCSLNLAAFYGQTGRLISLPTYPWQRQTYWRESDLSALTRQGATLAVGSLPPSLSAHPLLGARMAAAVSAWSNQVGPRRQPYLRDHSVQGAALLPASGFVEMGLAAARELLGEVPTALADLDILSPMVFPSDKPLVVQVHVDRGHGFSIHSHLAEGKSEWTEHARGRFESIEPGVPAGLDLEAIRGRCREKVAHEDCYTRLAAAGLTYGPMFRGIRQLLRGPSEALGRVGLTPGLEGLEPYRLHPVLLDACFQVAASISEDGTYLPLRIDRLELRGRVEGELWCHAAVTGQNESAIQVRLTICDDLGRILVRVDDLHCKILEGTRASIRDSIVGLVFEYQWLLDSGSPRLPSAVELVQALHRQLPELLVRHEREQFDLEVEPALERLSTLFLSEAFRKLGWSFRPGDRVDPASLAERLTVCPEHRKLLARLLHFLVQDGFLAQRETSLEVLQPLPEEPAWPAWRQALGRYPSHAAELSLLGRCGEHLAELLTGRADPLSILFADGSALADHFYGHSPTFRIYYQLMRSLVLGLTGQLPGKQLRILEVGGGTASLTSQLLPWLPASRVAYTFTDISNGFVLQARRKLGDSSRTEFRQLDLEQDPSGQGFEDHSFDLVLASDVLHATSDLRRSLSHLKRLLTPGGMLVALESTRACRWYDLVFGLLPGWWLSADRDHPLLGESRWQELLACEGFTQITALSDRTGLREEPLHSILVAVSPGGEEPVAEPAPELATTGGRWVLGGDNHALVERLGRMLPGHGIESLCLNGGSELEGATVLMICSSSAPASEQLLESLTRKSLDFVLPVQELMRRSSGAGVTVCLVTSGSQSVTDGWAEPNQAPAWSLRRVLASERPDWRVIAVDLAAAPTDLELEGLVREVLSDSLEDEVVLRGSDRFVHRLAPRQVHELLTSASTGFELLARQRRTVSGLCFQAAEKRSPGPGEVTLRVQACGLNFKDVAKLMGLLDDSAMNESWLDNLGLECSGIVLAVGDRVTRFQPGDRVVGFAHRGFRTHLTVAEHALVRIPDRLSGEAAATLPIAFTTAWLALRELAAVKPGERVLIHRAAGAVGIASIQVALDAGATVYATAGTEEKRDLVAALGATWVGDSRSLAFTEEILALTEGRGVDVVINTLPASALPASFAALKPFAGRLVDLANLYEKTLSTASLSQGVAFYSFDLEQLIGEHPERTRAILETICAKLERGELSALPHRVFEASEIRDAFQLMRSGRHLGKIVVSFEQAAVPIEPTRQRLALKEDGAYLISGGFGGVGLATARWLAEGGARHLVLVGRSGPSREARTVIEQLESQGVEVVPETADIASLEAVEAMLGRLARRSLPLRGIVHGAMVLEDMPLERLSESSLRNVLAPKVLGAWNLHQASLGMSLDFFVCHSSFASLLGNQDQGSYAAANGFMEALMQRRRETGLPGLAMCWGVLGEFGYVAKTADIRDFFRREGVVPLLPAQTWRSLVFGLDQGASALGVMNVDFRRLARYVETIGKLPRYSQVLPAQLSGEGAEVSAELERGPESLEQAISRAVARTLGVSPGDLQVDAPLEALGFDSLMAVELVVQIEEVAGVRLSKMALLQARLTTRGLLEKVQEKLQREAPAPASTPDLIAQEVSKLSDEQVNQLLSALTQEV